MAKDDNTLLYIIGGAVVLLFLRSRQAQPQTLQLGMPRTDISVTQDERQAAYRLQPRPGVRPLWNIGDTITIGPGELLPTRIPAGTQWYAPPTGAQAVDRTYTLEAVGTYHAPIDPRLIMGAGGGGPSGDLY